ncbi:DUF305 domain-containing protein [Aquipuribacter hungaricus]|uniref:DUF305 domain-containing protein n=1 Tax=Aquipuribacter hungaricus TaxID=545624 RepID=A0ABV7WN59_9MICO
MPTRRTAALGALVLAATLAGCSSDATEAVAPPSASAGFTAGEVPVLVPGSPGEPTTTLAPGEEGEVANPAVYSDADVAFVMDMVPHHTQALRLAELAPDRARDPRVLAVAERIAAGQGPEIEVMQAWLQTQGLPPADEEGDHTDHQGMPGMTTDEQMLRLVAAEDGEFDRMFLELMTTHHEGAIQMAQDAVDARNPVVTEMVDEVVASQGAEIDRMQQVLAGLG